MIGTKIEYTIDNFSGLINLDEYKQYEEKNNQYHYRDNRKNNSFINTGLIGVYFFYNEIKEIVYIGKSTNCIRQRLHCHIINTINTLKQEACFKQYKRDVYKYFSYIETKAKDCHFVESFLIGKYKPMFNIEFNNSFSYPVDRFDPKKLSIKDIHHRTRDSNSIKITT